MDDAEFAGFLQRIYVALRQQMEQTLKLSHGFQALRETLDERDPGFDAAYLKKLAELQSGELGKSSEKTMAQFDQVLGVMKNWKPS